MVYKPKKIKADPWHAGTAGGNAIAALVSSGILRENTPFLRETFGKPSGKQPFPSGNALELLGSASGKHRDRLVKQS